MMPSQITLPIVGIQFPNARGMARRFAVDLHRPGDPVELRPEPTNPADPNAIAVYSVEGVQMGYLPAERAPYVGMMMGRGGVAAIFQGANDFGAFVRIGFDEMPTLPKLPHVRQEPEERQEAEQEWWPDPEWPD